YDGVSARRGGLGASKTGSAPAGRDRRQQDGIGARRTERGSGVEAQQPAVLVLTAAVLDVGELLAQREGELPGRLGILEPVPDESADRSDDSGRAAGEDLHDVTRCHTLPPLIQRHRAALDGVAA